MVRWLKAVLMHHTSYLASVSLPYPSPFLNSALIKPAAINCIASLNCFSPPSSDAAAGPGHPAWSPVSHDREQSEDVPQTDEAAWEAASPNNPSRWHIYAL